MPRMRPWMLALAVALLAGPAGAQTLYKLIDKNGKVTYSEKPPKDFDGKVVPLDIDPTRNTATLPKYEPNAAPKGGIQAPGLPPGAVNAGAVNAAQERVDALRKQLQDARANPREDDYDHIGNAGGGARPVLNESYRKRVAKLEDDLAKAEAQLRRVEGGR